MHKAFYIITFLMFLSCNKNNIIEQKIITNDSLTANKMDSIAMDSIKIPITVLEDVKPKIVWNTFVDIPQKYSNESEANAYFFTDSEEAKKNGNKFGFCDLINNVAIVKINNKYEKLINISEKNSYLENSIYENENYRLELNLNEKISKNLQNKVLGNIELEGAFVLKGKLKITDLKNNIELQKETFLLGFN